jgi:transcriptional regulator with XRE-family HTH domain
MAMEPLSDPNTPKARADRLKHARKLARLTLREMSENGLINFNTLCGWEASRHGGLTESGARKVSERLLQVGVVCSATWLFSGVGDPPSSLLDNPFSGVQQDLERLHAHPPPQSEGPQTLQELSLRGSAMPAQIRLMELHFPHFIQCVIQDRAMEPYFGYGDFVAGQPLSLDQLHLAIGEPVIAQMASGKIYCRYLAFCESEQRFYLAPVHLSGSQGSLIGGPIEAWALVQTHFRYPRFPFTNWAIPNGS